jgi:hypothetical protein
VSRTWLREPLFHFLLAGGLLFVFYTAFGERADERADRVVVDEDRVAALTERFERAWMRPPTAEELRDLVEDHVTEEILYREAIALGLDRDDPVVRRRMRQKMEFLATDLAPDEPTEVELEAFLEAHPERFERPGRTTFVQVFLDPERSDEPVDARAARLLERLRGGRADAAELGDPILLPATLADATSREIASRFGDAFAAALDEAPVANWSGPIRSSYGFHLVRVETRTPPRRPALDEVREAVEREVRSARRTDERARFHRSIREGYEVVLPEGLAAESPTDTD